MAFYLRWYVACTPLTWYNMVAWLVSSFNSFLWHLKKKKKRKRSLKFVKASFFLQAFPLYLQYFIKLISTTIPPMPLLTSVPLLLCHIIDHHHHHRHDYHWRHHVVMIWFVSPPLPGFIEWNLSWVCLVFSFPGAALLLIFCSLSLSPSLSVCVSLSLL